MNDPLPVTEYVLNRLAKEEYCYLTTTGRVSGNPHEIEIWFGLSGHTLYLLSEGKDKSDWVKNLIKTPTVIVSILKKNFKGTARLVTNEQEDLTARKMLAAKYEQWRVGRSFSHWAQTALVVAIDLESQENKKG